jgi:probable lipoprotein NlpC
MLRMAGHFHLSKLILPVLLVTGLQGCVAERQATIDNTPLVLTTGMRGTSCCAMGKVVPRQKALVQTAVRFVGRSQVELDGRRYAPDCSGFVRGVYASQRVDLYGGLGELDGGNGVGRIYTHVLQHGRIHYGPNIHPGDLVFFHNTWDFNLDGLPNDPLTHVGMVESVEPDGTVVFLSWMSKGIERYRMNLQRPDQHKAADGRVLNDYMRRKRFGDASGTPYLAGRMFAAFGTLAR